MSLRDEITKSRNEMYADIERASDQDDVDQIITRIDEIEDEQETLSVAINILHRNAETGCEIDSILTRLDVIERCIPSLALKTEA